MNEFSFIWNFRLREQRSSSEDSMVKLLQYSPVIYEEDDAMAISAEAFEKMKSAESENDEANKKIDLL